MVEECRCREHGGLRPRPVDLPRRGPGTNAVPAGRGNGDAHDVAGSGDAAGVRRVAWRRGAGLDRSRTGADGCAARGAALRGRRDQPRDRFDRRRDRAIGDAAERVCMGQLSKEPKF